MEMEAEAEMEPDAETVEGDLEPVEGEAMEPDAPLLLDSLPDTPEDETPETVADGEEAQKG